MFLKAKFYYHLIIIVLLKRIGNKNRTSFYLNILFNETGYSTYFKAFKIDKKCQLGC